VGRPVRPACGGAAGRGDVRDVERRTVRLVTAYDDGNRVVLTLRVDGVHAGFRTVHTVTDARGTPLTAVGGGPIGGRPEELGDYVLVARRPAGGPAAGSALTLRLTELGLFDTAPETTVTGDWTLRFHAAPAPAPRTLPVPAGGRAGGADLDFTSVRLTDDYLDVGFTGRGTYRDLADLDVRLIDPQGDPAGLLDASGLPAVAYDKGGVAIPGKGTVIAVGRDGKRLPTVDAGATTAAAEDWAWDLHGRGTYRLVVTSRTDPGVRLERDIVVAQGAAGANLPARPPVAGPGVG
jgi:hypothetical protein